MMKKIVMLLISLFMISCGGEELTSISYIPDKPKSVGKFDVNMCPYTEWYINDKHGIPGVINKTYDNLSYIPGIQFDAGVRFYMEPPEGKVVKMLADGNVYETTRNGKFYWAYNIHIPQDSETFFLGAFIEGLCPYRTGMGMVVR